MKYCSNCKKAYSDKDKFCEGCGSKLVIEKPEPKIEKETNKSSFRPLLLVGIALLAIAIIGGMYTGMFFVKGSETKYVCSDNSIVSDSSLCPKTPETVKTAPAMPPTPYCGDKICQSTESCSWCPTDCGECPTYAIEISVLEQDSGTPIGGDSVYIDNIFIGYTNTQGIVRKNNLKAGSYNLRVTAPTGAENNQIIQIDSTKTKFEVRMLQSCNGGVLSFVGTPSINGCDLNAILEASYVALSDFSVDVRDATSKILLDAELPTSGVTSIPAGGSGVITTTIPGQCNNIEIRVKTNCPNVNTYWITPKIDKVTVQLFVMSFCPYGIQAEQAMKPVVDLLGSKTDIQVHFIASVSGTTPDSVQSLHGAVEAQEDLRQACIMKYYDQKTYWNYLMDINANCPAKRNDVADYDICWNYAATKAGIDVSNINTCSKGYDGVNLLKTDGTLTTHYGISGSPTLLINGVTYNGARTPDAYKTAICNAFTTVPLECSQPLSTTGSTANSGCG